MRHWILPVTALLSASFPFLAFAETPTALSNTSPPLAEENVASEYLIKDAPAVALHGDPKYPANFQHFDYVNPNAPKGGSVKLAAFGSFDNLNAFILKGQSATGLGLIYQSLTTQTADEAFSAYGELAQSITIPTDKSWVEFKLRPEAKWHDGVALTVEDVIWTFETLQEKGHPFYKSYYANVASVEKTGDHRVRFNFNIKNNHELPLIMGQLTILPKHYWQDKDFSKTTLEPPLGSGPYKIKSLDPGRSISYELVDNWWAKDLPVNRGAYNFNTITYEYFRDGQVMLEAFKAGKFDYRLENTAKDWAQSYNIAAVKDGRIQLDEITHESPQGMQAFIFNTRRDLFKDKRVRRALGMMLDFEWLNKNIFYGQYRRSESFFSNSELAATGLPSSEELAYLEPLKDQLDPKIFTQKMGLPKTNGSGNIRHEIRSALGLLKQAGWVQKDGILTHLDSGETMNFEILLVQPNMERVAQPFVRNLEKLGAKVNIRVIDTAQYTNRLDQYDFDMIVGSFPQSLSPGNEQRDFWGSSSAARSGGRNLIGIQDPAIDALIEKVIHAHNREELVFATRALDRALMKGWYVVPQWHLNYYRVAWWDRFGRPEINPKYGLPFLTTWWVDAPKDAALKR